MTQLFAFLLMLFPLVIIHELGHFIACKFFGIPVTSFAFGFGPKLFGFTFRGTEYCWNLLPLGGYVNYMGEDFETYEKPQDRAHFLNKSKWQRFVVLAMGPIFNLLLAYFIYLFFFSFNDLPSLNYQGEPYTVGYVKLESPEYKAGLRAGDRIVSFEGKAITSVSQLDDEIIFHPEKTVQLEVLRGKEKIAIQYQVPAHEKEGVGLQGFAALVYVKLGRIEPASAAEKAGLKAGDLLLKLGELGVSDYLSNPGLIHEEIKKIAPNPIPFKLQREGKELDFEVAPIKTKVKDEEGKETERWMVGIQFQYDTTSRKLSPLEAVPEAWKHMVYNSSMIFTALRKLVMAELSPKSMSSVIGVSEFAKEALDHGAWIFLMGMAILSLNLGIFNLLPIPVLDGGEIFVILAETVARREFNPNTKLKVKAVSFIFLIGLTILVIINDVIKYYF